ncbi:MAG: NADH dehydrogenase [ubiquinone] 1 alpha subcomplex assembly factor 7 [Paracoccaceae bacterium]|jgi:NADH dehydrogenase [ubiquinone] 1 alpha subcomplex assembly factor 7
MADPARPTLTKRVRHVTLKERIIARIRQDGPLSLADYMTDCLLHPTLGYYTTRNPFGVAGDFITAPEISQMFGELIGLSLAQSWLDQGSPARLTLAEIGPGRGTLMRDMLRVSHNIPGFHAAADIMLIEASPKMRDLQADTLANHAPRWIDSVADLPDQPLYLVANEFFDALPIRQYLRVGSGWSERCIGAQGKDLSFGQATPSHLNALTHRIQDTKDNDLVEVCPTAPAIVTEISRRIASCGGAALIVDYGDWRSLGDTLQAVRNHEPTDPLADPGQADLTAHVDFEALAIAARAAGCAHTKLTPQGVFLERLDITTRAQSLAKNLTGADLNTLISAHRRLTHPAEMGNLFKTLGLYPANATPPPGLAP